MAPSPSVAGRASKRGFRARGFRVPRILGLLTAAFLLAAVLEVLAACEKKEPVAPAVAKGQVLFASYCIACHNMNPIKDGTLGPALKGSSLDLLKARVIHGRYPPGYTPKRPTRIMQKLPLTEADVEAIHAFLNTP